MVGLVTLRLAEFESEDINLSRFLVENFLDLATFPVITSPVCNHGFIQLHYGCQHEIASSSHWLTHSNFNETSLIWRSFDRAT
jgi:hypothetical protein